MRSLIPIKGGKEANFEVQLNFNNNEFRIVHGDFGKISDTDETTFLPVLKMYLCIKW
ncbi:MAG: hypothetical protein CM15mP123_03770 [Gammaproteobacteria bacterium]|nr:MAG: hypothetical protein CM15mP123_03770 [Gammaproteobacteria bacterium]